MLNWRKQKKQTEPEHSRRLRGLVFAAMLVPLLALARTRPDLTPHVLLAALVMAAGHWTSYHSRHGVRQIVRLLTFVAVNLALCWLFAGLAIGATVPQAQFAIFAQAITSFDLRFRTSLYNTLIHSLAILYVAATLSRTTELALYLLLFVGLALAAFAAGEAESGRRNARVTPASPGQPAAGSLTLFGLGFAAITFLVLVLVFLLTPRYANRPIVPPFSLNLPLSGGTSAEIINPGVPLVQINGWSNGTSDYYYGFDTSLDLRYRGGLSNELVMYVRSPSRSYWRSHSYDTYDGVRWSQSDTTLAKLRDRGVYFELPAPLGSPEAQTMQAEVQPDGSRLIKDPPGIPRHLQETLNIDDSRAPVQSWQRDQQIVQTFNIVRQQPNLIFAAYRPAEIFLSTETLSLDSGDGLRLPQPLQAGMTYSVVSYRPQFDPAVLRRVDTSVYPPNITARYLQLPPTISERTRALARQLAAPHDNVFDQVTALTNYLRSEYPYNFYPPPHPPGAEVVDQFLFVDKEGVCEQYATSLVVLARSLGIPARLAAGYGAGTHNPVTGYYEVRYSDAHSWVEVYFPGQGWVPFDPTPGWTSQPYPTPAQNWLFANNGQLFNQLTGLQIPVSAIASGAASGIVFFAPFLVGATLLVGLVWLLWTLARRLNFTWPKMGLRYSPPPADETRRRILQAYRQAGRILRGQKYRARRPGETAAEYAASVGQLPALAELTELTELAAYRPVAPNIAQAAAAESAANRLKAELPPAQKNRGLK